MQVFAGLPLASELDLAVTVFRDQGRWPGNLQHLPGDLAPVDRPVTHNPVTDVAPVNACPATLANHGHTTMPTRAHEHTHDAHINQQSDSTVALFPTHLHQHPCERRRSAACGTRRRCRICNASIPHRSQYFHCSQNCRFTVCTACFCPSTRCAASSDARQRAMSEPPQLQTTADAGSSVAAGVYGQTHLTRYSDLSLEAFIDKVNSPISEGRFAGIGVPQVRVEGTTAWGAWLRINHRHSAFGRRPQLLCGVLFHAANRRLTFHGDAFCATQHVLPLFESWTTEQITELSIAHHQATALDAVSQLDPDSISSRNSDEDCANGVDELVADPRPMRPDAASEHAATSPQTLAIQELQSQVVHLSTMLTKVMQFIDEHLTNSNGLLNVNPPFVPPQPDPAHVPQHSRAIVPPPPPPPRAPVSNSSVSRLPPPPAPPPRFYQQPRPPLSRARHLPLSSFSRRPAPHRPNEMLTNTCCSCGKVHWVFRREPLHHRHRPLPHQPGTARLASVMLQVRQTDQF